LPPQIADGVREAGAIVDIMRVPETLTDEAAKSAHDKLNQKALIGTIAVLGAL
jgi:NAD(P)H dehydrogenase (quinone)